MNKNYKIITSIILMAVTIALYRVLLSFNLKGIYGITPIFSIALFSGAIFKNNKIIAFFLPLLGIFFSDLLWQLVGETGFYKGQLLNYALFMLMTVIGFGVHLQKMGSILKASVIAPTLYFLLSNFFVWMSGGGFNRPKTPAGLVQCYIDGLPFYFPWQIVSTLVFSFILFVGLHWLHNKQLAKTAKK